MFTGVTDVGEATILNLLFEGSRNPRLGLFKVDYTPDDSTILANLTPCDFPGYLPLDLTAATAPITAPDGQTLRSMIAATFTRSTAGTVQLAYGWFIQLDDLSGTPVCYAAQRFSTPQRVQAAGDKVEFDLDVIATDLGE